MGKLRLAVPLTAAAVAMRLPLFFRSLWHDELYATFYFLKNLAYLAATFLEFGVLPFYYTLMYGWIRLFGDSGSSVRILPLAAGLATLPIVYGLARRVSDEKTAVLAVLWLALSPVHA